MEFDEVPFLNLISAIVDNRGRTCPVEETGIPLIATNCVKNSSLYPTKEKVRFVSLDTYSNWFRGHPKPNDIIFVNKGSPGQVCLAPDPVDFCIAQDMVAIRADESKVDPRFLFALLRSEFVQRQIANMHVGTLIPHFKKGDFGKLKLRIPYDKGVQERIGEFYFTMSEKMELNHRMNQALEAIALTLFKSWFVDFDPVRAKSEGRDTGLLKDIADLFPDRLVDSEHGEIPEGWRASVIGDVAVNFDSRRVPLSKREREKRPGQYPYYGAASIMDYIDDHLFDGVHLLLGEDGTVADSEGRAATQYVWGKFWVNNHAHVIRGSNGVSTEVLYLHFKHTNIASYITGAVQPKLNQRNLNAILFVKAPDPVLTCFDSAVSPLFARIRSNSDEILVLKEIRDSLLPRLLSGERYPMEAA